MSMCVWDVFLNGKKINTVFYNNGISAEDVKKSLVEHDGFNTNIKVKLRIKTL